MTFYNLKVHLNVIVLFLFIYFIYLYHLLLDYKHTFQIFFFFGIETAWDKLNNLQLAGRKLFPKGKRQVIPHFKDWSSP